MPCFQAKLCNTVSGGASETASNLKGTCCPLEHSWSRAVGIKKCNKDQGREMILLCEAKCSLPCFLCQGPRTKIKISIVIVVFGNVGPQPSGWE